ncbi:MAG TPA: response regulator transcription factor [Desulfuromonadaceae bacterium]|nr:response regulator transcription factor [Desulfuromonadaceae bacterium]
MPIRIAIVEDDRGTREQLVELIGSRPSFRCVGAYPTAEDALQKLPADRPDVALVDIHLPGMNGIMCVAGLKTRLPDLSVLMLTRHDNSDLVFEALRAGASGYLLKKLISRELVEAIDQVYAGGSPMSMPIARKVVSYFNQHDSSREVERLSRREQEVLALLAKGYLNKEIAELLGISLETVRMNVKHIYQKLHVRCRTEAAAKYFGRA